MKIIGTESEIAQLQYFLTAHSDKALDCPMGGECTKCDLTNCHKAVKTKIVWEVQSDEDNKKPKGNYASLVICERG
jgi:hypothetical protein